MSSGRHAPESSKSFLISLGTAVLGAAAALGIVVGIALVALNAGKGTPTHSPTLPTRSPSSTPSASHSPSPSATPTGEPLPVKDTTLAVLNGTKTPGLARGFADRAAKAGYPVKRVDTGPATAKSTVFYRAGARAEALRFQRQFSDFTVVAPAPSSFKTDVVLTIVVGDDYTPPPSPSPSPSASKSKSASPKPSPTAT